MKEQLNFGNNENFLEDKGNTKNYDAIINLSLFILIMLIAYFIEIFRKNLFGQICLFTIFLTILLIFVLRCLSKEKLDKIKKLYSGLTNYLYSTATQNEINKTDHQKDLEEKIRKCYESRCINNNYNIINNNNNQYSYYNNFNSRDFNIKNDIKSEDEFLANKISNINKINNPSYFPLNSNTNYSNKLYTNNQNDNKISNTKINNFNLQQQTNNIVDSPFKSNNDSSSNFYLFSRNKNDININNISNFNFNNSPVKIDNIDNQINQINYNKNNDNKIINNNNYNSQNDFINLNNLPADKSVSYLKYQELKKDINNTQMLTPHEFNNQFYDVKTIPQELLNINYTKWVTRMKNFVSLKLLPVVVSQHNSNLNYLNQIMSYFGIKFINTLPQEDINNNYLKVFLEKINKIYSDEFKNENNNNNDSVSYFDFSKYLNNSNEKNFSKINNNNHIEIFFGDNRKIKKIMDIISDKLKEIQNKINKTNIINNNNNNPVNNINYKDLFIIINTKNNPFLKENRNKVLNDYLINNNKENNNTYSLTTLHKLLFERIIINDRLYPKELLSKINDDHLSLVIEYSAERLNQLKNNFSCYGNGSSGGDFLNERWCSVLPTDSQIISHIIVNYLEDLYQITNNNYNKQKFLLSYPNSYFFSDILESSKEGSPIFLYQVNKPDSEPILNVVCNNALIPCCVENNLFHAFAIYFYLLSIKSTEFVMKLGIHEFINDIVE